MSMTGSTRVSAHGCHSGWGIDRLGIAKATAVAAMTAVAIDRLQAVRFCPSFASCQRSCNSPGSS
jgi:hypothetical protein